MYAKINCVMWLREHVATVCSSVHCIAFHSSNENGALFVQCERGRDGERENHGRHRVYLHYKIVIHQALFHLSVQIDCGSRWPLLSDGNNNNSSSSNSVSNSSNFYRMIELELEWDKKHVYNCAHDIGVVVCRHRLHCCRCHYHHRRRCCCWSVYNNGIESTDTWMKCEVNNVMKCASKNVRSHVCRKHEKDIFESTNSYQRNGMILFRKKL